MCPLQIGCQASKWGTGGLVVGGGERWGGKYPTKTRIMGWPIDLTRTLRSLFLYGCLGKWDKASNFSTVLSVASHRRPADMANFVLKASRFRACSGPREVSAAPIRCMRIRKIRAEGREGSPSGRVEKVCPMLCSEGYCKRLKKIPKELRESISAKICIGRCADCFSLR